MKIENLLVSFEETIDSCAKHWEHDWIPHHKVTVFFCDLQAVVCFVFLNVFVDNQGAEHQNQDYGDKCEDEGYG
jgi:hypothetical protein